MKTNVDGQGACSKQKRTPLQLVSGGWGTHRLYYKQPQGTLFILFPHFFLTFVFSIENDTKPFGVVRWVSKENARSSGLQLRCFRRYQESRLMFCTETTNEL